MADLAAGDTAIVRSSAVLVRKTTPLRNAAVGAGAVAASLGTAASVTHLGALRALYALSLVVCAGLVVAAMRRALRAPDWASALPIEAGPAGLSLNGERKATRDELSLGTITPRAGHAAVVLTRTDGTTVEFLVQSVEQARSVLGALELDAEPEPPPPAP